MSVGIIVGPALAADSPKYFFTCGGKTVTSTYNRDANTSDLEIDDRVYTSLAHVRSGFGAKYESGEGTTYVMYWDRGTTALVQIGDTKLPECSKTK